MRTRIVSQLQRHAETRESPSLAWVRRMGRVRPVTAMLARMWPAVRPEDLVAELLSDPDALAAAAGGVLDASEQAAIRWPAPRTAKRARWSAADLLLIDEAAGLIERPAGFGHIVVDEAQDLSPMQCRVVARRSTHGSLTVLGDLAQATSDWSTRSWPQQMDHLGKPDASIMPLTIGFRVPASVVELSNRLLATLAVDVPPTRSLRADGELHLSAVADLDPATVAAVSAALDQAGSIAVICADRRAPELTVALHQAGIASTTLDAGAARVTVLPATLAKGLEYDHVVLVEPAEIVEAEPRGPQRLYVVLTRAVSRLDILHTRPLPAALAG